MELRKLSPNDGKDVFEILSKLPEEENGFTNIFFGLDYDGYKVKLTKEDNSSKGIGLKPGYVPQTIFWAYADNKPIGLVKIRHYLTDALREHGGHIGYALIPEERGKGYGKELLRLGIEQAKKLGIEEVLATCKVANIPSRKVIEANGGKVDRQYDTDIAYWIK